MKKSEPKQSIHGQLKNAVASVLELPKEIVSNLPLVSIVGNQEVTIENYKGVVEYSENLIRINTTSGVFKIEGKRLLLKQITAEAITITGVVSRLDYIL